MLYRSARSKPLAPPGIGKSFRRRPSRFWARLRRPRSISDKPEEPGSRRRFYGMNLAILLALLSTNQRLPSEPAVMPTGPLNAVGIGYSVMAPFCVILPILLALFSVNQTLPSGPAAMPRAPLEAVGIGNSVTAMRLWRDDYRVTRARLL